MAEITTEQYVDIRRTVSVVFDHDNRPEIERGGKVYQLTAAKLAFRLKDGKWANPWDITASRSQRLKDGSWGKEVWVNMYDADLLAELANEYRPTAIITITEESN